MKYFIGIIIAAVLAGAGHFIYEKGRLSGCAELFGLLNGFDAAQFEKYGPALNEFCKGALDN